MSDAQILRLLLNHSDHFLGDSGGGAGRGAPPPTKKPVASRAPGPKTPQVLPLYEGMTDGLGIEGISVIIDRKPERHRRTPAAYGLRSFLFKVPPQYRSS
jgi:hypothetical protein